ncbi:MAG: SprT-like domain-containing protein [Akkermansiaceae bacterium]|jgi:SprT protein
MKFSFLEAAAPEAVTTLPVSELRGLDSERSAACAGLLKSLGFGDLVGRVSVHWNARMRSCAGRATWPVALIELNPRLIEISWEEVRRTMLHELAHLVAYERNGNRRIQAHGIQWQQACADLGIPGERATHELSLPSRTLKRRWRYHCPACEVSFERVRKFKSRVACYDCCRKVNLGSYHEDFRLLEVKLSES